MLRTSVDGAPRPAAGGAVTLGAFATDGPAVGVPGKVDVAVTPPGFIDSNRFLALWGMVLAVVNKGAVGLWAPREYSETACLGPVLADP